MKPSEPSFDLARVDAASEPLLGEAVASLRANGPDATELASLASRLALAGIDVALPTPAAPRATARWKKWLAGGGAATGSLIWLVLSAKPPAPHQANPNQPSHALALEARSQAPGGAASVATQAKPTVAPGPQARTPEPAQPAEPTPAETPDRERAPLTAHEATTNPAEPKPTPATPATGAQPHAVGNGTPRTTSSAPSETPELRDAPSEIELLRDARLALKQSPARALTLVEAHARAYPGGKLTQERELIGISALVALGRRTAALSRGARFEHDFPTSPYRDQVEQLLR